MLLNLEQLLQSLRMVAGLADFLKEPHSLESVFKLAGSLKNSALSAQMFRYLLDKPKMAAPVADN
jgi:ubiquinone biosynthesis protein COQ4